MLYSKLTAGFYDPKIHAGRVPQDAVEISDELYISLLNGQSEGKIISANSKGKPVLLAPEPPTLEQIKQQRTAIVQRHIDATAKSAGYDDIYTACTYADEPAVPRFQIEGSALRAWRSLTWARCHEVMAEVQAGTREIPTDAELIALLPQFVAPA